MGTRFPGDANAIRRKMIDVNAKRKRENECTGKYDVTGMIRKGIAVRCNNTIQKNCEPSNYFDLMYIQIHKSTYNYTNIFQ
jgi:hypothetical protein